MTRTTSPARRLWLALLSLAALAVPARAADDVNAANEQAMKAAAARVAPSVVQILTVGGTETIGGAPKAKGPAGPPPKAVRKGTGPTTGVIVSSDGFVISSAFNFANKPSEITVVVPNRPGKFVADIVATDQTRMLTLLQLKPQPGSTAVKDLPVPAAFPKRDVLVGQWGLALGRTLDANVDHPPSISAGIVSATNRIWGKAIQTDAKLSPVNYGGPLVSIDGRVFGVIVPASTRSEGETAGFDWYDSGIGFAIPLEDVFAVLPRLKEGKNLHRGLLGINPQGTDVYNSPPVIGAIQPDSAAARAGMKVGDRILAIDSKPVPNFSTLQHILGPRYEGDVVKVKVLRGKEEVEFPKVTLLGTSSAYVNAFLGVLPLRDDPAPGVPVRFVYPKSPADTAGIKPGDRIMKIGRAGTPMLVPLPNRAALASALAQLTPGTELKLELKRKEGDKVETVTVTLGTVPQDVPEGKLPMPSSAGKALEGGPKKKDSLIPPGKGKGRCGEDADETADGCQEKKEEKKTGFLERTNAALGREYWLYVPDNYDPNTSHGLIVWFHPSKQGGKDGPAVARTFREFCEEHHFIIMGPTSTNAEGWVASETEGVMHDVKAVMGEFTIDKTRVIAHGMGSGGEMAFYLGFNARDTFRGVATVGAVLGTAPKENVANQPLSFFVAGGDKDPAIKDIELSKTLLAEKRFPVVFRKMQDAGKEYFDVKTFEDMLKWMDSLDRL